MQYLFPSHVPKPVGPYTPVVVAGQHVYIAGQVGIDPANGELCAGFEAQVHQTLRNVLAACAAGSEAAVLDYCASHNKVVPVSMTCYLTTPEHTQLFNAIYETYFPESRPVRATVFVGLPKDILVEISATAFIERVA